MRDLGTRKPARAGLVSTDAAMRRLLRQSAGAGIGEQHGFLHAGAVAAVLDSACGYAAFSVMQATLSAVYDRPGITH